MISNQMVFVEGCDVRDPRMVHSLPVTPLVGGEVEGYPFQLGFDDQALWLSSPEFKIKMPFNQLMRAMLMLGAQHLNPPEDGDDEVEDEPEPEVVRCPTCGLQLHGPRVDVGYCTDHEPEGP